MILVYLVFILSPFWCMIMYTTYIWGKDNVNQKTLWHIAIMLSVYLGCLGTTHEMNGDFLGYSETFFEVPQYDFITFILSKGKEPLYYGYNYISYYLYGGNYKLFIFSLTALNYLLLSYVILKVGYYLKSSKKDIIVTLFFTMFFFQEFAAMGNLIRQCLVQSIVLVFFVRWYIENKRSWWIAISAFCVHTSCLPVLGIGMLPVLKNKFKKDILIKLIIYLSLIISIFYFAETYLVNVPFIGYIFRRVNSEQLMEADSWQVNLGLSSVMIILLFILAFMLFSLYKAKIKDTDNVFILINLNILLVLFIVVCNQLGMYYLLMRYEFYIYAFQNVLLLIYIHHSKFLHNDMFRVCFMGGMILYFYYEFSHNIFSYIPVLEALVYPLPIYCFF